jgi:hypothetical protein
VAEAAAAPADIDRRIVESEFERRRRSERMRRLR